MEKRLRVHWWDGSLIGHLVQRGPIYFVYDEAWIKGGHNLSPLSLPFTAVAFNGSKGIDGLPGLIADCLPDSWGLKVARKEFAQNKWGEPTPMSLLAWRGTRGLGALQFAPVLQEDIDLGKLETISAAALARGASEIQRGEPGKVLPQLAKGGTAGGAYPKALVVAYPDGTLRVGPPDGVGEPCLLKFDLPEGAENTATEHAYAEMAQAAGIRTVKTRLLEEEGKTQRRHLLVSRFDLPDAKDPKRRFHFHSASGLLHKAPGDLDYLDLFRTAIRLNVPPGELRELARRMVFNVLSSNHDDHGKNHAFLYHEDRREWSLTPAYDVTYDAGILERGTLISGEVWPTEATMEALCLEAALSREEFQLILKKVRAALKKWPRIAKQAGLSAAKTKEVAERHQLIQSRISKGITDGS
jgi:serine/threonine-protein kinase HipA